MDVMTWLTDNRWNGRYRYTAYINDHQPRYLVVWSVHWALIDCQRLEPGAIFSAQWQRLSKGYRSRVGRRRLSPSMASYSFATAAIGAY